MLMHPCPSAETSKAPRFRVPMGRVSTLLPPAAFVGPLFSRVGRSLSHPSRGATANPAPIRAALATKPRRLMAPLSRLFVVICSFSCMNRPSCFTGTRDNAAEWSNRWTILPMFCTILPMCGFDAAHHREAPTASQHGHTRRGAWRHGIAAWTRGVLSIAPRGVVHCATALEHGHTGRVAMRHGLGAWTHGPCSNAPRPWRMDTRGVVHCSAALQHGHTGRGALLHGLAAWTHGAWRIATRPCSMDTRAVVHCCTARAAWTHGGGAMLRGLGALAGEGAPYSPPPSRIVCPGFFFRAIAFACRNRPR